MVYYTYIIGNLARVVKGCGGLLAAGWGALRPGMAVRPCPAPAYRLSALPQGRQAAGCGARGRKAAPPPTGH